MRTESKSYTKTLFTLYTDIDETAIIISALDAYAQQITIPNEKRIALALCSQLRYEMKQVCTDDKKD